MEDKSLYEMILEKLGVEEGEKFNVILEDGEPSIYNPYYFKNGDLYEKHGCQSFDIFVGLIAGRSTIEKLPWKPKDGDTVYCIGSSKGTIYDITFYGAVSDLAMLKCGWYFKTKKEAEANKERVLKEMREVLNNE